MDRTARPRLTRELVQAAGRRVFGEGHWPDGINVDWVQLVAGSPMSAELVFGPAPEGACVRKVGVGAGLRLRVDRQWARDVTIFWNTDRDGLSWNGGWLNASGWKLEVRYQMDHPPRRFLREKWEFIAHTNCFGENHVLHFGPRGARSEHHTPEELRLLETLGEGCGELFRDWRAGGIGEAWDHIRRFSWWEERVEPPSVEDRWRSLVFSFLMDEIIVSGLDIRPGEKADGTLSLHLGNERWDVGLKGPRSWFERVWKRGIRASWGRFPLDVRNGNVLWIRG